ncbi:MAG: hypothetical protein U0T82_17930 [Bacteroidales bacterium]
MPPKPHLHTDLIIYEEIISGRLHPALPRYGDLTVLQTIAKDANTQIFCTCGLEENPESVIEGFDFAILGYRFREDVEILIKQNSRKRIHELVAAPARIYSLEEHISAASARPRNLPSSWP